MKTLILISAMALGLMGVGCSKSNTNAGADANTTNTTASDPGLTAPGAPGGTSTGSTTASSTVTLTPASLDAMRAYVLPGSPYVALNNPTNIKLNINLAQVSGGRYGGSITISYTDNGQQYSGTLSAGSGTNPTISGGYDNGTLQANYNYWFTLDNQLVFSGFFEDQYGAIALVLTPDEPVGGGNDAEPLTVPYKGSIYFKNFKNTDGAFVTKNQPYRSCWFIYTGVFDCRSNVIMSKCSLVPGVGDESGNGYTLLGTFTNVDIKQAFNLN